MIAQCDKPGPASVTAPSSQGFFSRSGATLLPPCIALGYSTTSGQAVSIAQLPQVCVFFLK